MKNEIEILKSYISPEVERLIEVKNLELQETAIKKGKFFASKNLPAPTGDTLANYTNESKASCEKLDSDVNTILQVPMHLANGAMLKKRLEERKQNLEEEERTISNTISNEEFALNGYNPYQLEKQRKLAIVFLSVLFLSELFFNAKAFQVYDLPLPDFLYKYVSIENAIKTIETKTLWFSSPNTFKDPFDCNASLLDFNLTHAEIVEFIKEKVEEIEKQDG